MPLVKIVLVLFVTLFCCNCRLGVDLSSLTSTEVFKCFLANKYDFAIVRAYKSYGAFDLNSVQTLTNAKNAGFTDIDVYMFPCISTTLNPTKQIADML